MADDARDPARRAPAQNVPAGEGASSSSAAPWIVVGAVACWLLAGFGLFQMALVAGGEAMNAQLGVPTDTPTGVYAVAVIGGMALAAAFVACLLAAARRGRTGLRTALLVAGGGLLTLGLVVFAMMVQQWSLGLTVAESSPGDAETTLTQGMLFVASAVLLVGAATSGIAGLLRRSAS